MSNSMRVVSTLLTYGADPRKVDNYGVGAAEMRKERQVSRRSPSCVHKCTN